MITTAAQQDFKNQSDPTSPQSATFIEPMLNECAENVKNSQGVAPVLGHSQASGRARVQ